jgi:glycosyltransferase involved in cell wall biosynthesis
VKRILQIGNWPPPVCGWSMSLVGLRQELLARGWQCEVMNLNENRRVRSPEYIDVQGGWDYFRKVGARVRDGFAVHTRVNAESKKGYLLAVCALALARLFGRPALLTYCGGHQQSYFPAPRHSLRHTAFFLLFRLPHRIFCNSEKVKQAVLTSGIREDRVIPIPHFSTYYVQFTPTAIPSEVEEFCRWHKGVFASYVCFRKEFKLEFVAEAIRRFRSVHPEIGFLFLGTPAREIEPMRDFLRKQGLENAVCLQGSLPHETFLTILSRSIGYIRTPMSDGVCSSVLESLKLKVPVLGSINGARPAGTELWKEDDLEGLLRLMDSCVRDHDAMVARIPEIPVEDNAAKMAESIEALCHEFSGFRDAHTRVPEKGVSAGGGSVFTERASERAKIES